MPNYCAVKTCKSFSTNVKNNSQHIRFFHFPKNKSICKLWIEACGKEDVRIHYERVCSLHFTDDDWTLKDKLLNTPMNKRSLNPNAVPTKCLAENKTTREASSREKRANKRVAASIVKDALEEYDLSISNDKASHLSSHTELLEENASSKSIEIQTEVNIECAKEIQIMEMKKEIATLRKEKLQLKKEIAQLQPLESSIKTIFTSGQIKKLKNPNTKIKWSLDDISSSFCLYSAGPRAYRHLYNKNYPLPGPSTLSRWAAKIDVRPGILEHVLKSMNDFELNDMQRICIISFDEMKIRSEYACDKANVTVIKPKNYVQVVMVRGLTGKWKQPIFYDYDCRMTTKILMHIIFKLHQARYVTVAIVSDMGTTNQGLWEDLKISSEKPWFKNPADESKKVFVFVDVPHLIKLLRNHFLDSGFIFNDKKIDSGPINELLQITSSSEVNIIYKVTDAHINVKNAGRQQVKLATQLFSHTTSSAIKRAVSLGICKSENALLCADFIKSVNDWFDVFNSKVPASDSRDRTKAYGLSLELQYDIIKQNSDFISQIRCPKTKTLLPFQKGILLSNSSLPQLYNYLKEMYNFKFIITYRLNQDVLENFFSVIRAKGGLHDHPSALEFKYRLRGYLLGRRSG